MIEQKKKLRLDELQVESFVTTKNASEEANGGTGMMVSDLGPGGWCTNLFWCAPLSGWPAVSNCAGQFGCPPHSAGGTCDSACVGCDQDTWNCTVPVPL
jgi:hypothetical protein